ncbi:hypothetical protein ABK046_52090, partial [Streptomyces caeruleatus]
ATFTSGCFVSGRLIGSTWNNGVWFGGYSVVLSQVIPNQIVLTFNPYQYDSVLGLTILSEYEENTKHNQEKYVNSFYLL